MFSTEEDPRVVDLRKRLDRFYKSTKEYTAFHENNWQPEFWQPIKAAVEECLASQEQCRILELGAGCTGFGSYIKELQNRVIFDVQDVTPTNEQYLSTQADNVYICDLKEIHNKYDIIFSTFVWEHLTTPKSDLDRLLNLLNPEGKIFIVSPRYDFPFYLSPSAKHLSFFNRLKLSIWLIFRRLQVLFGGEPNFLIHLEPALFYDSWFRDADAIHWVSLWDLKRYLPKNVELLRLHLQVGGLKGQIWQRFCLLFIQIKKLETTN